MVAITAGEHIDLMMRGHAEQSNRRAKGQAMNIKMGEIKRIALLSVHTCPMALLGGKKTGGMNVYIRELAAEFGRRGILVDVFTRRQHTCRDHSDADGVVGFIGPNARVIHIRAGADLPLDPDQVHPLLPEFVEGVLDFADSAGLHYDLIYSHYWLSGLAAKPLRAAWGTPVVQMFHTLGLMKERIAVARPPHISLDHPTDLRSRGEADIMTWADGLIAATPAEHAQMLWLYRAPRRKISIIPPGVNLNLFRPIAQAEAKARLGLPANEKTLLFVGRIEPLKGVDTILEALALLRKESPALMAEVKFRIIGGDLAVTDNPELARLLQSRLGLEEAVIFLGAKAQDQLNDYYAAAEALIMPSDYESFGMVALEAMASGTPVIASNVGGLAFLVRDTITGYHVPVREPGALAERVRQLLATPGQRSLLGQAASQHAAQYSWTAIADMLLAEFAVVAPARAV
jgi:D-inositol-3-phosphate glycosyltransferase